MRKKRTHDHTKRSYCHPSWSLADRIAYYSKPEPLTGCHVWHGALLNGYGILRYQGRHQQAHRLAWTVNRGPIPAGMILCHRCNVRRCVNPDHLALGTRADNNADTKAARLRLADAREATARPSPAFDRGAAAIRIFVGGIEMRGRVLIEAANPRAENEHASLRSTRR
jgi:hypothetical protein